ncbi:MAG: SAM hydrolase/SAM-dependent halogenase family protein, partial [Candidatus Binatia bacterium]
APFFPQGTLHVAVVDPGVGANRRPLLIETAAFFLIGPDNGIFSFVLQGERKRRIFELSNRIYHLKPTSSTFHGRDIFAPVAGYLSLGIPPQDLGSPVEDCVNLGWPEIVRTEGAIQGEIVYIDAFGNLITNIHDDDLVEFQTRSVTITLGDITVGGLARNYTNGGDKGYVALINSMGLLEISLYKRNAHLQSGIQIGGKIEVREGRSAS